MPLLPRRRRRSKNSDARASVIQVVAEEYEDGDTVAIMKSKVKARLEESNPDKPFRALFLKFLEALLPFLLKLLGGLAT